jgi:hypothetical protein
MRHRLLRKAPAMPNLDPRSLLLPGLLLEAVEVTSDTITIRTPRITGCLDAAEAR